MADVFSTNTLNRVVQELKPPPSWTLDRYFRMVQTEESEEIHFDLDKGKRRLAPFVSPVVQGRVVQQRGFETKTFKPAYVKDKRVFDPRRPLKRIPGEQIGGSLSPADRIRALVAQETLDQIQMVRRRLEVMAMESLRTGAVTVSGEGYQTVNVDFGRAAALEPAGLGGTASWDDPASKPLDDLQDYNSLVLQESGSSAMDVILDVTAWKAFRNHASVQTRLDLTRARGSEANLGAIMNEGGVFMGTIDGFNIFVYQAWYINDAGTEVPVMDAGRLIMTSSAIEGVQAFGAILDERAELTALPWFVKSWLEQDPAVRFLMLQSAPLTVPYRINASLSTTVIGA